MREDIGILLGLYDNGNGCGFLKLIDHTNAHEARDMLDRDNCKFIALFPIREEANDQDEEVRRPASLRLLKTLLILDRAVESDDVVNSFEQTLLTLLETAFAMGQAYPNISFPPQK